MSADLAGLKTIPIVIRVYIDKEMAELDMLENHTQQPLSHYDEGMAFVRLIDEHGYTIRELCELFDVSLGYITNRVGCCVMAATCCEPVFDPDLAPERSLRRRNRHVLNARVLPELRTAIPQGSGPGKLDARFRARTQA